MCFQWICVFSLPIRDMSGFNCIVTRERNKARTSR
jgi:hypothetical protein